MSKHTPGPWAYSTSPEGWSYTINIYQAENAAHTPDYSDVAFRTCTGGRKAIQEANARLIAAAPDLLEALWVCMEHNRLHHGDSHNTVIQARAAIAKAEGT